MPERRAGGDPIGVLVLGVGSNVTQGILKALRIASIPSRVIAACIDPLSAGLYVADRAYVAPRADDPKFVDWVVDVCSAEEISAVLSGVEPNLVALAPQAARIRERTGAVVVVSPREVLDVAQDKLETARWLERNNLPFAPSAAADDDSALDALVQTCGLPLVAKPRAGRGGRGVMLVDDDRALTFVRGRSDLVVQRLLGDDDHEYTAGCFCDRRRSVIGSMVMRRRLAYGTTVVAEAGEFAEVRGVAERVTSALGPIGPCNVQLRMHDGVPTPFELNVRFSGTTPMRARLGFNEVEAALRHLVLGEEVVLPRVTSGLVIRYWNELYVDARAVEALRGGGALMDPKSSALTVEDWGAR